ncbi:hypothetical protein KKI93_19935 [Xenorhabdus bovienii]|uniref:hypothetical protein n=1 Tax=Xenorhabdus bovienii TaxID=40576 RepID=UPI0023B25117|nr:hypothetical protein [Xenorhabdus bovienii]MDE9566247.1 hypothetical protein [Xenorhabdus bovienii]
MVGGGSFGAFLWERNFQASFGTTVRDSKLMQNIAIYLCNQKKKNNLLTESYLFGSEEKSADWGNSVLFRSLPTPNPIAGGSDINFDGTGYPVTIVSGDKDDDHNLTAPNVKLGGMGFKGPIGTLPTTIICRRHTSIYFDLMFYNKLSPNSTLSIYGAYDNGHTMRLLYIAGLMPNKLTFTADIAAHDENEMLIFRIENPDDNYPYFRTFIRGLIVCSDW